MHKASHEIMRYFAGKYLDPNSKLSILDVGSYDVNGNYKDLFQNPKWKYYGLDIEPGPNVDLISKSVYDFGLKERFFDVVVSGNTLEHVEAPWVWIQEIKKVIKENGLICIIVPFFIGIHRHPLDCWRIAPDGMRYLLTKHCGFELLECNMNRAMPCDVYGIARYKTNGSGG